MRASIKVPKFGRVPVEELQDAILALIKEGVTQSRPMSIRLGWSVRAVVTRLQMLQDFDLVHRTASHKALGGLHYHWNLGPHPEGKTDDETERRVQTKMSGNPIVVRSTSYGVIGQRDPLVAALFGAPKASNESYCMEQGAA